MTQIILKEKLAKYLEIINPNETVTLRDQLLNKGFCYGLSVCYASMKLIGKLDWWEAALVRIINWNGKAKFLKHKANLPQSENPQETLGHIFERVLNYIVYNQRPDYDDISLTDIWQANFLYPESKTFDILGPDNKLKQIVNRQSVAGHFTNKQIKGFLCKKYLADTICLIHSTYHTISISYIKPYWIVYDSNYPHDIDHGKFICKKFLNKKAFVKEIVDILGNSIAIEYASLKNKVISIPGWDTTVKKAAYKILDRYGFHLIVAESPDQLPFVLKEALTKTQDIDLLVQALACPDEEQWYGFHKLLFYAGKHLPLVLEYVAQSTKGPSVVTQMLAATVSKKKPQSGLFLLLCDFPEYLPLVLDLVERVPEDTEYFAKALLQIRNDESGWDLLRKKAPECKYRVTKLLINNIKSIHSDTLKSLIKEVKLLMVRIQEGTFFYKNKNKSRKLFGAITDELACRSS